LPKNGLSDFAGFCCRAAPDRGFIFPPERGKAKMASKNKICTLKLGEIEMNPILALSTSGKDVERHGRVTQTYGNVTPAIVGQSGNAYRILAGQAWLLACAHNGIQEMPVVVAEVSGAAEQMKLALLLSTVRQEGGALSEGTFSDALLTEHGVTRQELMGLLKKSKSWISKRQLLALKLTDNVKGMVKDGVICARTAEEIARLPGDVQLSFACKVVRDGLSKTNVEQLVSLYTYTDPDGALRDTILESPQVVLDAYKVEPVKRRKENRSMSERIAGNAGFLIRMGTELKGLLAKTEPQSLNMVTSDLNNLRVILADLLTVLDVILAEVSPGKLQGGEAP
jgi:ParB-like chromosome segregation protein Spo0J